MLTRRGFLKGAAGTFGVGLLNRYQYFVEEEGAPILEAPRAASLHYYASLEGDEWLLTAGEPRIAPDTPTWKEFFVEVCGARKGNRSELLDLCSENGIEPGELNSECDWERWFTYWNRHESPQAHAYYALEQLDIGPFLEGADGEIGEISFIDGAWPGSDYLGVHAVDDLSISLLQARLNQLETGIEIHLFEG